jgi:predicted ATP-dependent serine protease
MAQAKSSSTSARNAAPSSPAGRASAIPAASGTRSSRKAPPAASAPAPRKRPARAGRRYELTSLSGDIEEAAAHPSGIAELDRVTGGGFVRGSALLVGGDPGIGKSTLLTAGLRGARIAGERVVYISGEEAVAQVRLRAERMGVASSPVELAAETNVEDILATCSQANALPSSSSIRSRPVDRGSPNPRPAP